MRKVGHLFLQAWNNGFSWKTKSQQIFQFRINPQSLPESLSLNLMVIVNVCSLLQAPLCTSSLLSCLFTNPGPYWPTGPRLFMERGSSFVVSPPYFTVVYFAPVWTALHAFIDLCPTLLRDTYERINSFGLKRKSNIDSTDSKDCHTTFPSVLIFQIKTASNFSIIKD